MTTLGFHALVLSAAGTVLIDPYRRWDARYVLSYFKDDARRPEGPAFHCDVHGEGADEEAAENVPPSPVVAIASGTQLRTYRLALAATGEYSTAVCAPNPAAVACAMNAYLALIDAVDAVHRYGHSAQTVTWNVAGAIRANSAVVGLNGPTPGSLDVQSVMSGGTDFVIDVTGYFK